MGILLTVNVYVFIPMVLFLYLEIVKKCQKLSYKIIKSVLNTKLMKTVTENETA